MLCTKNKFGDGMEIQLYKQVRLLSDRFETEGAKRGDVGTVIEAYPDGNYEVEFSRANGVSYAQIVARADELELVDKS